MYMILLTEIDSDNRMKIYGMYDACPVGVASWQAKLGAAIDIESRAFDNLLIHPARGRNALATQDEMDAYLDLKEIWQAARRETIALEGALKAYVMSFKQQDYETITIWHCNSMIG